ncbi:MAG: glycosyltransferase family 4 protein [Chloroflexota bacterium]|nr:glycosyltransferase family 4 protein [Chloroflexota bacterium]
MKVIYDISTLGLSYQSTHGQAGVFRTAQTLAYRLAATPDCELTFSASESLPALHAALAYLAHTPALQAIPLPHPYHELPIRAILDSPAQRHLNRTVHELSRRIVAAQGVRRWALKMLRRGPMQTQWLLEKRYPPIEPRSLAAADIFHSPMYAIPAQAQAQPRLCTFLTVYDLIPILQPQFFSYSAGHDRRFRAIMQSLLPDGWALCISEATKADLCNYLPIAPERVQVTYLAADPDLFYPCTDPAAIQATRRKYGIPEGAYILSVNTLEPRKNIAQALHAFARLVHEQHLTDLSFVLVGAKGWQYDTIFDTITAAGTRGLQDRIIVTGYVEDDDLAPLYSGATAFVYPSFYEGFGLPPLEAMQCGVPVISSNTSSLPEVVGDAGILVDPHDGDALCQALWTLYRDPAQRATLAAAGLARAQRFSWAQTVAQTLAAYQTALDAR